MLHKNIAVGDVHVPYNWSYANAAARTAATGFVAGDVGTLARQTDDNTLWMLTATTPTWVQVGGGGSITAKDEGSNLTTAMTSIDFVGAGVTATNTGGAVTVTIPGGGGGGSADPREMMLYGMIFGRRM